MRYKVIYESESGHDCCFGATVVDTTKPHMHHKDRFEPICECIDPDIADQICEVMNKADLDDQP